MMTMRSLSLLGLLCIIASVPAVAQNYPSHVITIVVPNPPGGPSDLFARWIGSSMSKELARISHTTLAQFPDFVAPVGDFSGLRALAWRCLPQSSWTSSW